MTKTELSKALDEFISKGGKVQKLPPSRIPTMTPYHSGGIPVPGEFDGELKRIRKVDDY